MKELIVKENRFPIRADGLEICYDTQHKIVGEIVRCKDCTHYDTHGHRCKHWNHGVMAEDYCSKGERIDT